MLEAVYDERNFETAAEAIKDNKKHFQATICYSVTESHMGGDVFNLEYFYSKIANKLLSVTFLCRRFKCTFYEFLPQGLKILRIFFTFRNNFYYCRFVFLNCF